MLSGMTSRRSKHGPAPLDRTEKRCSICGVTKPLEEFGADSKRADGRKRQCKACLAIKTREWNALHRNSVRATRLRKKFGIEPDVYVAHYKRQRGRCAICRDPIPNYLDSELTTDHRLGSGTCVDHDHATGRVRGLLCGPCNKAIGYLKDDPKRCDAAAKYLRSA